MNTYAKKTKALPAWNPQTAHRPNPSANRPNSTAKSKFNVIFQFKKKTGAFVSDCLKYQWAAKRMSENLLISPNKIARKRLRLWQVKCS